MAIPNVAVTTAAPTGTLPGRLRIRDFPPLLTFLGLAAVGACLVLASWALHIQQLRTNYGGYPFREVGYLGALNWSVVYTFIFPLAAYLMLQALQCVPAALRSLGRKGMIRAPDNAAALSSDGLLATWHAHTRTARLLMRIGIIIAMVIALVEWKANNLDAILQRDVSRAVPEVDWGIAAAIPVANLGGPPLPSGRGYQALNAGFDFLCFLLEGTMIASVWCFLILMTDLPAILAPDVGAAYVIVPDLRDGGDDRRGFQIFAELLVNALFAAFAVFLMLFLSRLQKLYMRADASAQHESIGGFLRDDFLFGFTRGAEKLVKSLPDSGTAQRLLPVDSSTTFATPISFALLILGMFLLAALVLVVIGKTLRSAGQRAQSAASDWLEQGVSLFPDVDVADQTSRAASMKFWPLRYPSIVALACIIVFAFLSLYFYRLGVVTVGVIALALITFVLKNIIADKTA